MSELESLRWFERFCKTHGLIGTLSWNRDERGGWSVFGSVGEGLTLTQALRYYRTQVDPAFKAAQHPKEVH